MMNNANNANDANMAPPLTDGTGNAVPPTNQMAPPVPPMPVPPTSVKTTADPPALVKPAQPEDSKPAAEVGPPVQAILYSQWLIHKEAARVNLESLHAFTYYVASKQKAGETGPTMSNADWNALFDTFMQMPVLAAEEGE